MSCSPAQNETAYVVGASSSGVPFTFLDVESSAPRGIMVDIVRAVGEEVDDLAFALVAPLAAHHNDRGHR